MPSAIGRSNPDPSFFTSAGDRLTVMWRGGSQKPQLCSAERTREYASRTAASGSPTSVKPGCAAWAASTSIVMRTASMPSVAADQTLESMVYGHAKVPHRGYLGLVVKVTDAHRCAPSHGQDPCSPENRRAPSPGAGHLRPLPHRNCSPLGRRPPFLLGQSEGNEGQRHGGHHRQRGHHRRKTAAAGETVRAADQVHDRTRGRGDVSDGVKLYSTWRIFFSASTFGSTKRRPSTSTAGSVPRWNVLLWYSSGRASSCATRYFD